MKTYIKKAAALLVILAAVLTAMPQTVRAGDEYGFEILVEPSPAPIGGEVTLTVSLTDYDETKAGIRGFQIDIYNVGNTLQNSQCTTLVTTTTACCPTIRLISRGGILSGTFT